MVRDEVVCALVRLFFGANDGAFVGGLMVAGDFMAAKWWVTGFHPSCAIL
jgi:hypothetical protein